MDYQASASSSEIVFTAHSTKIVFGLLIMVTSCFSIFAQTTTNPLTTDVTITATVLYEGGGPPSLPPVPPGGGPPGIIDLAIFKGRAYPGSTISVLKNSIVIATVPANQDGSFDIRIRSIAAGTYTFGIQAKDTKQLTSKLISFTVYVSGGITTIVDGIFIPPTITSDKIEVKKNDPIIFSGSGVPNADIRLSLLQDIELLKQTKTNASGTWYYSLDSSVLLFGDYEAKARSILPDDISFYSDPISFRVGSSTRLRADKTALSGFRKRCDLNSDGRVNLLDFSIMAFWYKRFSFPDKVDLNTDKQVNLTDLSILAYCWTG